MPGESSAGPPEKSQECASMSIRKTEGFVVTLRPTFVSDVVANQGITQKKRKPHANSASY
jgi:hypothetical protein